ncbi:MAG: integrase catalytic domain-containing protein [Acidimicrobiales bacterium]
MPPDYAAVPGVALDHGEAIPELMATRPNEVWTYDATALRGPTRGVHYDLLVMIDILSRYVPGWLVVDIHDGNIVKAWIAPVVAAQGDIEPGTLTVHADRGRPMTSAVGRPADRQGSRSTPAPGGGLDQQTPRTGGGPHRTNPEDLSQRA